MFPILPSLGPREKKSKEGGPPNYFKEGFVHVQKAIDYAIIKQLTYQTIDIESMINLNFKRYVYPPYLDDGLGK